MNPPAPPRMVSRPQFQANFNGQKVRAVRNAMYFRPMEETFYDFQLNLLLWTLGNEWFDAEMLKPPGQRHVILEWRAERNALLQRYRKPSATPSEPITIPLTGNVKALQVLATTYTSWNMRSRLQKRSRNALATSENSKVRVTKSLLQVFLRGADLMSSSLMTARRKIQNSLQPSRVSESLWKRKAATAPVCCTTPDSLKLTRSRDRHEYAVCFKKHSNRIRVGCHSSPSLT